MAGGDPTTIRWELDHGSLTVTLARAAQRSAFTVQMAGELVEAFEGAAIHGNKRVPQFRRRASEMPDFYPGWT